MAPIPAVLRSLVLEDEGGAEEEEAVAVVGIAVLALDEADEDLPCLDGCGSQKSPNDVCGWVVLLRAVLPLYCYMYA